MIYYIYAQLLFIALIITIKASMNGEIFMISLALTNIILILIQFVLDYQKYSQYLLIFIITILSTELSIQYSNQCILVYTIGFSLPLLKFLQEFKLQLLIHMYFIYLALRIIFIQTDYLSIMGVLILQPMIHLLIIKYSQDEYQKLEENKENIEEKQKFQDKNLLQYNMTQSIFHNFPQGTLVLDQQLQYIDSNKKIQKYFQAENPEQLVELIDQSLFDVKQCDAAKFLNEPYFLQLMSKSSLVKDCSELKIQTRLTTKEYENIRTIVESMATSLRNCDKMENKKICLVKIVKDRKYIYLRVKVFTLQIDGKFIYLLTFENIKKMEEFILLADKNKFQQALLNSLCHELRTPMNCTMSSLQSLQEILNAEQLENFLKPALVATKRLTFLINDILDYGEIVSNNLILNVNHFFSEDIYLSLLEIFSQECKIKNIKIEFNQENISLITDRERLLRILINLIDNSIKFCPQNGIVKLSFKLQKEDQILVQVEDNGQGMTNEIIDRIYSENYIQERSKHKTYKLGLGLRICKLLTKQLFENCNFSIQSTLGVGTNISFVIQQVKLEGSPKKSGPVNNIVSKKCDCVNILIVDDVAFNHFALNQYLRAFKLKSESAFDGQQAITMVNQKLKFDCCKNYTLVFMDIEMPGINGYSTSQYISSLYQSNNVQCLIVMCSAYTSEKDVEKAKEFGMQKILPKPIDKGLLQKIINKYYL